MIKVLRSDVWPFEMKWSCIGTGNEQFEMHRTIPILKRLHDIGDILLIANVGGSAERLDMTSSKYQKVPTRDGLFAVERDWH